MNCEGNQTHGGHVRKQTVLGDGFDDHKRQIMREREKARVIIIEFGLFV